MYHSLIEVSHKEAFSPSDQRRLSYAISTATSYTVKQWKKNKKVPLTVSDVVLLDLIVAVMSVNTENTL